MLIKRTKLTSNGASYSELFEEYSRCKADPIYFIKTYCKIDHPVRGPIPFTLYDFQEQAISDYQTNRIIVQLAARQTGKTHVLIAYTLWFALFHTNKTVLYVADSTRRGFDCRDILNRMLRRLPAWIKIHTVIDNKRELILENGCKILFIRPTPYSVCGISASLVICDEFAYVDNQNQEEFFASIIPTLYGDSSMIIASTRGPEGSFFNNLCNSAPENIHKIVWDWDIVPGRRSSFKDKMIGIIGLQKWNQEYMCSWDGVDYGSV